MARVLRPREIFATLAEHKVRYVVIGGLAAVMHGSAAATGDVDICPDRAPENLDNLATALREMHARIRTSAEPEGIAFAVDAASLARMAMVNLVTDFGDLDISYQPAAFSGYDELMEHASTVNVSGVGVPVASLGDVIRSKATADRPKDRATLPILEALYDEMKQRRAE
jgi:predicted nucleotidyltransferase